MAEELYNNLAKYYDLIYQWKDYEKESREIKRIIYKYKKSKGNDLLEVACGTGSHLKYLQKEFSCLGVDLNNSMLEMAKKKVPNVILKRKDMINLNIKKKFDIILCLFSSIGYVKCTFN